MPGMKNAYEKWTEAWLELEVARIEAHPLQDSSTDKEIVRVPLLPEERPHDSSAQCWCNPTLYHGILVRWDENAPEL